MRIPNALASLALAFLFPVLLGSCVLGGTGSDHENGVTDSEVNDVSNDENQNPAMPIARVLDPGGGPQPGVALRVLPVDFLPDKGEPPALLLDSSGQPLASVTTDAAGAAPFKIAQAGVFIVEGSTAAGPAFFDTVKVEAAASPVNRVFQVQPLKPFQGRLRLESGYRLDSAVLFIRGTSRWQALDSSGTYNLGELPHTAERMGVGLRYTAGPRAVKIVETSTKVFRDSAYIRDSVATDTVVTDTVRQSLTGTPRDSAWVCRDASPADSLPAPPQTTQALPDSLERKKALESCGVLQEGTQVNIVKSDSAGTAGAPQREYVQQKAFFVSASLGANSDGLILVQCVESGPAEQETYDLRLGADGIVVEDITDSPECGGG